MIHISVPNLLAMRAWILRLDARLVSPELQQRWMAHERQACDDARKIKRAMESLGVKRFQSGGEA